MKEPSSLKNLKLMHAIHNYFNGNLSQVRILFSYNLFTRPYKPPESHFEVQQCTVSMGTTSFISSVEYALTYIRVGNFQNILVIEIFTLVQQ